MIRASGEHKHFEDDTVPSHYSLTASSTWTLIRPIASDTPYGRQLTSSLGQPQHSMSAMGYIPILLAPLVLAMWALAVFLVVKFFAICAEKFYAATTGKALSSERCNLLVAVTCLAITFIAPVWVFKNIQVKGYEAAIPQALQITDLIYNSEQGLHESCGAAVFKLSPSTVSSINTQGLVFFKTAVVGRGNRAYHLYAPWQSTSPYNPAETPLLRGSPCLIDPPEIWHSIQRATRAKGAFFTVGSEYDLVVIPTLGVVVFSFNG